ncbi:FG-nucleoporin nsp1, partial [Dissophora globulifera]
MVGAPAGGGFGSTAGGTNNLFGAKPATSTPTASFGFGSTPASTGFGAPASTGFGAPASTGFGAAASGAPSMFGGASAPAATASPFGAPAPTTSAPGAGLFGGSTPAAGGFGGFGAPATSAPSPSPLSFGGTPASSAAAAAAPSPFGATSAAPSFGAPTAGSTSLFGGAKPTTPAGGLFGATSAAPATTAATASPFGSSLNIGSSAAPAAASLFGAGAKPAGPTGLTIGVSSGAGSASSLFAPKPAAPSFGSTLASTTTTSAPAPAFGLSIGGGTTPASSGGALSLGATSAPGFSLGAAPAASSSITPGATSLTTKPQDDSSSKIAVPPTPSALRNKSMDEIVQQWSKQLEEHTKAFREQAKKISEWDGKLFKNGDQISKLYQTTVKTEETQRTIDQNLDYIDAQQQELSGILDLYEEQVQKLFEKDATTAGVNASGLRPVDEQREQTYSLAENLNKQLDDMSLNLTSMIEDINQATPKTDGENSDP